MIDINVDIFGAFYDFHRPAQNRKVADAQKIHLDQSGFLDGIHIVLGGDRAGFVIRPKWRVIRQRNGRNHNAGGVNRGVPRHALDFFCKVDDFFRFSVLLVGRAQFRGEFQRLLDGHMKSLFAERNKLGDLVAFAVRHAQDPADVADRGAGEHTAESHDLRHLVFAVFGGDVFYHFVAAVIGKIGVDIRRQRAF